MKNKRIILALGAFFVLIALAISGCGSSGVPDGAVATVAGNTISKQAFNHWMFVAAKEQASQSPGQPVIVPNDPPKFDKCLTNVRAEIPALKKTADKQLRADCKQLFTSLSSQVMDSLVKAYRYHADAQTIGNKVTDAQVQTPLAAATKGQVATAQQFHALPPQPPTRPCTAALPACAQGAFPPDSPVAIEPGGLSGEVPSDQASRQLPCEAPTCAA